MKKKIYFISTNEMWSGSEELWVRSAKKLSESGMQIFYSTSFEHIRLEELKATKMPYYGVFNPPSLLVRIAMKLNFAKKYTQESILQNQLKDIQPDLVVISQGNNISSLLIMNTCRELNIKYITVSQLVAIVHVLAINENNLKIFQEAYEGAIKNFFVSNQNLELNNKMLGLKLLNSDRIFNPCKLRGGTPPSFPKSDKYQIALVGRLECYHKGLDLFLSVVGKSKWQSRNIQFNVYGNGPHLTLLKNRIVNEKIEHVVFKDHEANVKNIWKKNHLLLMTSRIEGQALSLIEAMWCERAAVITDVGGSSELIEEGVNGFVAESSSEFSIDAALERAWVLRNEWELLGKQAAISLKEKHPNDEVGYFVSKIYDLL